MTPMDPCPLQRLAGRDEAALARAFRALANPHRLAIYLRLLRQDGDGLIRSCSLQALIDKLDIGAPTVSHHVKELVNAGLITITREGKHMRCTLDERMRQRLTEALAAPAAR